jgi:hypothetical protein
MKTSISQFIALILILCASVSQAASSPRFHLSAKQMEEVINIANAINVLNPRLEESKYLEYAMGIHRAAMKYSIDPMVLIAITQQETTFREGLPEGKAGEIGICQIRKMWLSQGTFIKEFKKQSIAELKKPAKSFMFAAWILKGLQGTINKGSLPYWSYYNSVRFENRFKYFLGVNRYIATLRRFDPSETRLVASADPARPANIQATKPAVKKASNVNLAKNDFPTSRPSEQSAKGNRWIPDAIVRVQAQQTQEREIQSLPVSNVRPAVNTTNRRRAVSAALIRAAVELNAGDIFPRALQD